MKRKDLIKRLTDSGCVMVRHGSRHDLYKNPVDDRKKRNVILKYKSGEQRDE